MLLPATPCAASSMLLHAAIDRFRKVWSLAAMKRTTCATRSPGCPHSTNGGSRRLISSPLAAALRLCTSAHVQRLRDQRLQFDRPGPPEPGSERGPERFGHPAQPLDHLRAVGAEAQHLAQPLVHVGGATLPGDGVLHDPHRHRRADDPRHRADRVVVVARRECDAPVAHQRARRVEVACPAFEQAGTEDRALHRTAHVLPRNRGTGVREASAPKAGHDVARDAHVHQHRLCIEIRRIGLLVGFLDARIAHQGGQRHPRLAVALGGRLPFKLRDPSATLARRIRERVQTDVDDARLVLEPEAHRDDS